MTRRTKRRLLAEINVVPYIDVVLVLLIIFMATAPIVLQGAKVDLPQYSAKNITKITAKPVVVTLTKSNKVLLALGNKQIKYKNDQDFAATIKKSLRNKNQDVFLRADKSCKYDHVAALMVKLQNIGVDKVSLVTDTG